MTLSTARTAIRARVGLVGRAAHIEKGIARSAENAALTTAISSVSSRGCHVRGRIDGSGWRSLAIWPEP